MEASCSSYSAAQALRSGGPTAVRAALLEARGRTLALADAYASALATPDLRVPCDARLNLPLWEWGHVAWFQEFWIARNLQRSGGVRCDPAHARPAAWLAQADAWYDSSQVSHRTRWDLPLPGPDATREYLAVTLAQTLAALDELPADASDDALYFFRLVALHEWMHVEAATYMARTLGITLPATSALPASAAAAPATGPLQVPAQQFRLGYAGPGFAFDNELGAHEVQLDAFEIDAEPVSWRRYLPFVDEGGYARRAWWSDAGWTWLQQTGHAGPEAPADLDAPAAHLTAHEADAWCRWASRRLPTEAEWECAACTQPAMGVGRVWEWTASAFLPYPGFEAHPYRDYSAPWFGTRRVLRGASEATSVWLAHPRYRNFFEPHRNDVVAGFRSCR